MSEHAPTSHVTTQRLGAHLRLVLNRPERRNAITVAMYDALAEAVEGAASDPSVRVITISGEGADFTAGFTWSLIRQPENPVTVNDSGVVRLQSALSYSLCSHSTMVGSAFTLAERPEM